MKSDLRPDLVPITKEVSVPFDVQTCHVGHGSQYIHWLMDKFDVDINISPQKEASNIIQVTGPSVNIQHAELALAKTQVVTVDLNSYPWNYVWHIEDTMKWISCKHDVGCQLPEIGGKDKGTITIIGYEENCEDAREEILQLARQYDLVSITKGVSVPFDIQTCHIGHGRQYIHWLMDKFDVVINIYPKKEASNIIQVHGRLFNVHRAELALAKVVTVDLNIHPKHSMRQIVEAMVWISLKHDVGFQLPEIGGKDQGTITIIGYEENCEDAREEILQLARQYVISDEYESDEETLEHNSPSKKRQPLSTRSKDDKGLAIKYPNSLSRIKSHDQLGIMFKVISDEYESDEETLEHNSPSKKRQPLSTRSKDDKGLAIKYPSSQSRIKSHDQFGIMWTRASDTSSQVKLPNVPTTVPAEVSPPRRPRP